jgi:hypothetical protein
VYDPAIKKLLSWTEELLVTPSKGVVGVGGGEEI